MRMKERLYLTEDRSEAVKESDRRGRHLLCKKGATLDDKVAAKYGLVDGCLNPDAKVVELEQIVSPETKRKKGRSRKTVKPVPNKQVKDIDNK